MCSGREPEQKSLVVRSVNDFCINQEYIHIHKSRFFVYKLDFHKMIDIKQADS